MALIQTVSLEASRGDIKKGYDIFTQKGVDVPAPLQLLSASPALFSMALPRLDYFSNHPTLSFALLTHIRYLVACTLDYDHCKQFNRSLLKMQGAEEDDLRRTETDPAKAPLEEHERSMLQFVMQALKDPQTIGRKDINALHAAGWRDSDILDALVQGTSMRDHHLLMQVFHKEEK